MSENVKVLNNIDFLQVLNAITYANYGEKKCEKEIDRNISNWNSVNHSIYCT